MYFVIGIIKKEKKMVTFNVVNSQERVVKRGFQDENDAWKYVSEVMKFSCDSYEVYPQGTDEEITQWEEARNLE